VNRSIINEIRAVLAHAIRERDDMTNPSERQAPAGVAELSLRARLLLAARSN
jgi:hypothetical protein